MDKSSMLHWFPLIKDLAIPQPRTEIITLTENEKKLYYDAESEGLFSGTLVKRVEKIIKKKFKLPVFVRTDQTSAKHHWKETCFIDSLGKLKEHIFEITAFSRCCDVFGGLPIEAIIVREYIPMKNLFTAFYGNMPVNPEIRFFIKDGRILCKHWYWIPEAINNPSVNNWSEIMDKEKKEISGKELFSLTKDCRKVAGVFKEGYWSVDFCKAKDGRWILIDMAEGGKSWHPEECKTRN